MRSYWWYEGDTELQWGYNWGYGGDTELQWGYNWGYGGDIEMQWVAIVGSEVITRSKDILTEGSKE